jgi:pimeloyl-ACP methyl ester carboxylesterase
VKQQRRMKMNKTSKKLSIATLVILLTAPAALTLLQSTQAQSTWTLITDSRPLKAYPNLKESIWQANATMAPNGPYDKIALHRLVLANSTPTGVIFMTGCPTWGTGEFFMSNPSSDNWTKYENFSQAIYWANRGFDVYAIDYRSHTPPKPVNTTQAFYTANWTWDVWVSDIKQAANQVKQISGANKFFLVGQCSGGEAALNYATKYWQTDLNGIITEDFNFLGVSGYPVIGTMNTTNTYNLTQAIINMTATNSWIYGSAVNLTSLSPLSNYTLQNPGAPAQYPPGTPLQPTINPATNTSWTNITEWYTWFVQNDFGATTLPPGLYANLAAGYGNVTQFAYCIANTEIIPQRLILENMAMADWVNCTYLSYDYNDHYSEINVPILAFEAGNFANASGTFRFVNGTATNDFTGVFLPKWGHTDLFFGTMSAQNVSQPALTWMMNHTTVPPTTTPTPTTTAQPTTTTSTPKPSPTTSNTPTPPPPVPEFTTITIAALFLASSIAFPVILRKRRKKE